MKKLLTIISAVLLLVLMVNTANSRPIFIGGVRIYWAKWEVTFGNCEDGKGLCFRLETGTDSPQNFFGYDPETSKVLIKVNKKEQEARHFNLSIFTLEEDSPVDPKIIGKINEFKTNGKIVVLKKGIYKVMNEGDFYILNIDYYLQ